VTAVAPVIVAGLPLLLRKRGTRGRLFEVCEPFVYLSGIPGVGLVTVPAGFVTNFHSIPFPFRNLFDPTDFAESAVVHDWLYDTGMVEGRAITRKQADLVHRELLLLLGAPAWHAAVMYAALRIGGGRAWRKYRKGQFP
jgi:hypothetical protein